jgi:hypothetical protein
MPELEGPKRLQPRMTRGTWRLSIWSSGLQVLCFSVLAFIRFNAGDGVAGLWIFSLGILVSAVWFVYLLRVRRNDAHFWNEEETRRAEWDRRGRQL